MPSRITKWITTGLTTALVSAGLIALAAPPAVAATTVMRCSGFVDTFYTPGLTNVEQQVAFTGGDHATACTSQFMPNLRSFEGPFKGTGTESCLGRFDPGASVETLYWNGSTNLTSVWPFSYTAERTDTSVIYTATGRVTSGVATGTTITQQIVEPLSDFNACTEPGGMTLQQGTSTWTFTM